MIIIVWDTILYLYYTKYSYLCGWKISMEMIVRTCTSNSMHNERWSLLSEVNNIYTPSWR